MFFKLSVLNSNLVLTLGYLNPALNNSTLDLKTLKLKGKEQEAIQIFPCWVRLISRDL